MPIEMGPPSPQVQPFNITPVQYQDPLETLARMQQLKTQGLQQQQAQLGLQQAKMQMDSNKAMLDAFVNGGGDPDKTYQLMTQSGKVLPDHLLTYQQHVQQYQVQKATLRKDQQDILNKDSDILAGLYTKVANLDNPTQDDWNAANAEADRQGVSSQVPRTAIMPTDKQHMLAVANGIGALGQINDRTLKGAQIAQEQAGTEEKKATTKKTTTEQQLLQHQIDLYNTLTGSPEALAKRVAGSIDPAKYPDLYSRALNEARNSPDLKGINESIQKYAQQASEFEKSIATETDPKVIQARINQRISEAQALAPIETSRAITVAKALRQGDNPELAGVPPAAILGVQNQAIKLDEQYAKEKAATEALGRVLDLAQNGNKAAGTNLPLLGVETLNAVNGIKRVNSAEIHQYTEAGSLWDQIVGRIGKLTVGQPIPQDVLNDIRTLHQSLGQQSYQNYTDSLKAINARSGATLSPKIEPPNITRGAPVPVVKTKADFDKLPSGTVYTGSDGKKYRKP